MRVIATAVGYDGICVRQPGEEFDMPDGSKGSWFATVKPGKKPKPEEPKPEDLPTGDGM